MIEHYFSICKQVFNGHIKRITDPDIRSLTLEIIGNNVSTTFISCPTCPYDSLGIRLPFLVLVVKNLKRYFTFEVEVSVEVILKASRMNGSNYNNYLIGSG